MLCELHHPGVAVAAEWSDVFIWETDRAPVCEPLCLFICADAVQ